MVHASRAAPASSAPGIEEWRRAVTTALKGTDRFALQTRTRDGILVEPLYQARDNPPLATLRGSRPWIIVQEIDDEDPDRANEQARAELEGGATGLSLSFAGDAAAGSRLPASAEAMSIALEGIDLAAIHIRIEPHRRGPVLARALKALVAESGVAPELASIAFGLDPIGPSAFSGEAGAFDGGDFVACVRELSSEGFRGPLIALDGCAYHRAGASEAQEVAAILASAAWWLRAFDESAVPPEDALPRFGASVGVDCDQFLSIAKLRALQLAWARFQELCGTACAPIPVHAATSLSTIGREDPFANLLRTTVAGFAAAVGGADSILIRAHDARRADTSPPDSAHADARALARNIHHLLIHESKLHLVMDAAAGSGALESLTEALAERSWAEFQQIEREGGIVKGLRGGALQRRIAEMRGASDNPTPEPGEAAGTGE